MKNNVKERRAELGLTQEALSEKSGVGRSTISEIEDDKHTPGVDVALRIARALKSTVEELFG